MTGGGGAVVKTMTLMGNKLKTLFAAVHTEPTTAGP
jgi:hypothetical protein